MNTLVKLIAPIVAIACVIAPIPFLVHYNDVQTAACDAKGGVLISQRYSNTCVKKDGIIYDF